MEELLQKMEATLSCYQHFSAQLLGTLRVSGQSLSEWQRLFYSVRIPTTSSPLECRKLSTELLRLNQVASRHFAEANAKSALLAANYGRSFDEKLQELIRGYAARGAKTPAAVILESEAKLAAQTEKDLAVIAEFEKDFWKDVINYITRKRKQLENITMNNALMNKIEGYNLNAEDNESPEETEEDPWIL